jgi:hypothetical protein
MDQIPEESIDDTTPLQSVVITSEGEDTDKDKNKKKNDKEVCLCILCFLILFCILLYICFTYGQRNLENPIRFI